MLIQDPIRIIDGKNNDKNISKTDLKRQIKVCKQNTKEIIK